MCTNPEKGKEKVHFEVESSRIGSYHLERGVK